MMLKLPSVSYKTDEEATVVAYCTAQDKKGVLMASSLTSTKWLVLSGKRGEKKKQEKEDPAMSTALQKGLVSKQSVAILQLHSYRKR